MKKKLAIVGSGISAMTCAYYLKDRYDISIFEKNDYLGGHTHTHDMEEDGRHFTVDTGFIVFNEETYPNMLRLFASLGVEKQPSEMSFSVYNQETGLEYAGTSLATVFAQKKNLLSIKHLGLVRDILRFFKVAKRDHLLVRGSDETIGQYCRRNQLSNYFIDNYLAPMSSAVWSTPQNDIYNFPIALLLPFFFNHGLLSADGQYQWYTVKGGSNAYTKKILESATYDIHLNEAIVSAAEIATGVKLRSAKHEYVYDYAILASHADESLKIASLAPAKQALLEKFGYNPNIAVLHCDEKVMPKLKKVWTAWNHVIGPAGVSSTVYWLNKLQNLNAGKDYFVSINPFEEIAPEKIIKKISYQHPNFTTENFLLQPRLQELNQDSCLLFAGSYFGYGFHEDGVKSGLAAVKVLINK